MGRSPLSSDGHEQRWADSSQVGHALMCTTTLPRGLFPLFPASETGEIKGAMPESKGSLCPCISPHSGSLERSEARPWSHSSLRARPWNLETRVPWQW